MSWEFPKDVAGWLTFEEGQALAELARHKIVLEIGSYAGRSTICMAQTAHIVHSIDWHNGDRETKFRWTLPDFAKNLRAFNLLHKVVIHCGRTEEVAPLFKDASFDLAFIDGAHDTLAVMADIRVATRLVKPEGILAFHDAADDRVKEAIRQALPPAAENYPAKNLMWRRLA